MAAGVGGRWSAGGLANRVFEGLPPLTDALAEWCRWRTDHAAEIGGAVGFHRAVAA